MKSNRSQSSEGQGRTRLSLFELMVVIAMNITGVNPTVAWLQQRTSGK
jgi:hypothetical protein